MTNTVQTMKIHQVTTEYHAVEDRLLLKINVGNQAQFHFWLTRRFCSELIDALAIIISDDATLLSDQQSNIQYTAFDSEKTRKKVLGNPETKQAIMDFQRDAALSKANFNQNDMKPSMDKPFGKQPMLAAELIITPQSSGLPSMEISDVNGRGLKIKLDDTLLHSLYKLLTEAVDFAKWQL